MPPDNSDAEIAESDRSTRIRSGLGRARAATTARAYWREWLDFAGWCRLRGHLSMPAEPSTVTEYLSTLSLSLALSSLHRKLAAISCAHSLCELPSPTH